jgi:hypothetical protein
MWDVISSLVFAEHDIGAAPAEPITKASPTSPQNPKVAVQDGSLPRVRVSLVFLSSWFPSHASYSVRAAAWTALQSVFDCWSGKQFLASPVSRLALWPDQPPLQLVWGSSVQWVQWLGHEAVLVRRLGMHYCMPTNYPIQCFGVVHNYTGPTLPFTTFHVACIGTAYSRNYI